MCCKSQTASCLINGWQRCPSGVCMQLYLLHNVYMVALAPIITQLFITRSCAAIPWRSVFLYCTLYVSFHHPLSAHHVLRADGKGSAIDLPWTKGWYGVTSGFEPPMYNDGSFTTYKLPAIDKSKGCSAWACDQFKGMFVYRTKWNLPKDYKCNHCKLQFYYLTASSCWPPCMKEPCKKPVGYAYCGQAGATYPEEFWNCADISIKSS